MARRTGKNVSDARFIQVARQFAAAGHSMKSAAAELGLSYAAFVQRKGNINDQITALNVADGGKRPLLPDFKRGGGAHKKNWSSVADLVAAPLVVEGEVVDAPTEGEVKAETTETVAE